VLGALEQIEDAPVLTFLLRLEDAVRGAVARARAPALPERTGHGRAPAIAYPALREKSEDQATYDAQACQRPHETGGHVSPGPLGDRGLRGLQPEAPIRVPQHALRHRVAFGLVGVEQPGVGLHLGDECELPPQVEGVAHPEVHPLSAGRTVDVRGVANQEDIANAEALSDPAVYPEQRGSLRSLELGVHEEVLVEPLLEIVEADLPVRLVRDAAA
jgi:hypothetical protein